MLDEFDEANIELRKVNYEAQARYNEDLDDFAEALQVDYDELQWPFYNGETVDMVGVTIYRSHVSSCVIFPEPTVVIKTVEVCYSRRK